MPLTVFRNDTPVHSWDYNDLDRWQALRRDRHLVSELRFPCCDSPVVLKVSVMGMPFFAHTPGRACVHSEAESRRESVEHQALKYAIALHLSRMTGWTVRAEVSAPDQTWRADVLAIHRAGKRLAVEPQLSRQSAEAFHHRSVRYLGAGIMPAWITAGLPAEFEMRSVAHFQIDSRRALRCSTLEILSMEGATAQWGSFERLALAEYLDRMADPDAEWPWRLEAVQELKVRVPKSPHQWPPMGPPPANESERLKAMYARLVEAAEVDRRK